MEVWLFILVILSTHIHVVYNNSRVVTTICITYLDGSRCRCISSPSFKPYAKLHPLSLDYGRGCWTGVWSGGCSNGEWHGVLDVEVSTCHMTNIIIKYWLCLLLCCHRTFLASVILASKFLQDKCYSNHAWAKLSGCMYVFIFSYSFYFYFMKVSWVQVMSNHVTFWNININKFKCSSWTTTFMGTTTTRTMNGHHVTLQTMGMGQAQAKEGTTGAAGARDMTCLEPLGMFFLFYLFIY